jgi:hypothetical protein
MMNTFHGVYKCVLLAQGTKNCPWAGPGQPGQHPYLKAFAHDTKYSKHRPCGTNCLVDSAELLAGNGNLHLDLRKPRMTGEVIKSMECPMI